MNLVNEIKNLKYNYKPNLITLNIKKINKSIDIDIIYSTENQYILDTTDVDTNIVGNKKEFNIITLKKDIVEHILKSYSDLNNSSENKEKFEELYQNIDWLTIYICALLDLEHVVDITLYFYKKYAFVKISFNDGNFETFVHLNIFFNQDLDMEQLKKDIEPFGQDEINYIQSADVENCHAITQLFNKDFSKFPFEELYENILKTTGGKNNE